MKNVLRILQWKQVLHIYSRTILDVSVSLVKEARWKTTLKHLGQKIKSQVKEKGNKLQIALDTRDVIGSLIQEDLKQIIEVRRKIPL